MQRRPVSLLLVTSLLAFVGLLGAPAASADGDIVINTGGATGCCRTIE